MVEDYELFEYHRPYFLLFIILGDARQYYNQMYDLNRPFILIVVESNYLYASV